MVLSLALSKLKVLNESMCYLLNGSFCKTRFLQASKIEDPDETMNHHMTGGPYNLRQLHHNNTI